MAELMQGLLAVKNSVKKCLLFLLLSAAASAAPAGDAGKTAIIGNSRIYLDPDNLSTIVIENRASGKRKTCRIQNWVHKAPDEEIITIIKVTTDKKAMIFPYPSNRYLLIADVMACDKRGVKLHNSPAPINNDLHILQDINFDKHLYLTLMMATADDESQQRRWAAIIASFGNETNLIKEPGFFNETESPKVGQLGFLIDSKTGSGMISPDGKYVAPDGLDCVDDDTFPGTWDIEKKKRVVFPTKLGKWGKVENPDEIFAKCKKLFYGEATLEELGGQLK